jgi:hypothetical protein
MVIMAKYQISPEPDSVLDGHPELLLLILGQAMQNPLALAR